MAPSSYPGLRTDDTTFPEVNKQTFGRVQQQRTISRPSIGKAPSKDSGLSGRDLGNERATAIEVNTQRGQAITQGSGTEWSTKIKMSRGAARLSMAGQIANNVIQNLVSELPHNVDRRKPLKSTTNEPVSREMGNPQDFVSRSDEASADAFFGPRFSTQWARGQNYKPQPDSYPIDESPIAVAVANFDFVLKLNELADMIVEAATLSRAFKHSHPNYKVVKLKKKIKKYGANCDLKDHQYDYIRAHPVQYVNWITEHHLANADLNGSHGEYTNSDDVIAFPLHMLTYMITESALGLLLKSIFNPAVKSQINGVNGEATNSDDVKKTDPTKGKKKRVVTAHQSKVTTNQRRKSQSPKTQQSKKSKKIPTSVGPRRRIIDGVVAASSSDTTQHRFFNGVDEKQLSFEAPVAIMATSTIGQSFLSIPISAESLSGRIKSLSASAEVPNDLVQLITQYAGVEWTNLKFNMTFDVPPLIAGKVGVLFVPEDISINPLNANGAFDLRAQLKLRDHWQLDAQTKNATFNILIPKGSRPVRGEQSTIGHLILFIREEFQQANVNGGANLLYVGKIGTLHVAGQVLGQYRTLKSANSSLFYATTLATSMSTDTPYRYPTSIGADANYLPLNWLLDPDEAEVAANTMSTQSGNKTISGSFMRNTEPILFDYSVVLSPLLEVAAAIFGVPPGVATVVIAGIEGIISKSAFDEETYENEIHTIQSANDMSSNGVVGGATTGTGVVTSTRYQPGVSLENISGTNAWDSWRNWATTHCPTLLAMANAATGMGVYPLAFTWPFGGTDPALTGLFFYDITLFESTNASDRTYKRLPAPHYGIGSPQPQVGVYTESDLLPWNTMVYPDGTTQISYLGGEPRVSSSPKGKSFYVSLHGTPVASPFSEIKPKYPTLLDYLTDLMVVDKTDTNEFTVHHFEDHDALAQYFNIPSYGLVHMDGDDWLMCEGDLTFRLMGEATQVGSVFTTTSNRTVVDATDEPVPFGFRSFTMHFNTPTMSHPLLTFGPEKMFRTSDGIGIPFNDAFTQVVIYELKIRF